MVVLQTSSHNPTGCEPTRPQWFQIACLFQKRNLFAFLDAAYLGFVSGGVFIDAEPFRIFVDENVPLLLAATYGKAFGLYGERVGSLSVVAPNAEVAGRMEIQMKLMARAETGAQPAFGAKIVETILTDSQLNRIWQEDVSMIARTLDMRRAHFRHSLDSRTTIDWGFLMKQKGIFAYVLDALLLF